MNVTNLQINEEFRFQLNQKCEQIGTYLLRCKFDKTNGIGLLDGLAGVGLLLSLYYRKTFNGKYSNKLKQIRTNHKNHKQYNTTQERYEILL